MSHRWRDYDRAAEHGPVSFLIKSVFGIFIVLCVIGALGFVGGWFTEAASVVREEFGPRAALKKYEWFKDSAAVLEAKRADIDVYSQRITDLEEAYEGAPRREWDRSDKEDWSLWRTEVAGIKASYNSLAAEYNAAMAKINWRFAERGKLPPGATNPLPREFKPYIDK